MRMQKTYRHFLLATTVLALTVPAGHLAAEEHDAAEDVEQTEDMEQTDAAQEPEAEEEIDAAEEAEAADEPDPAQEAEAGQGFQIDGQDLITRGQAILELDVVDPEGQTLGQLEDFIIDFSTAEVRYALLTAANGAENDEQMFEDEEDDEQAQQQEDEEDDLTEAEDEDAEAAEAIEEGRLYPIPLAALSLEERPDGPEEEAVEEEPDPAEEDVAEAEPEEEEVAEEEPEPEEEEVAEEEPDEQQRAQQLAEEHPVYGMTVDEITGTDVYNEEGEEIASVREVIVDRASQDIRAVLGVGGFLGIGEHEAAIPLEHFQYSDEEGHFILAMTTEEVQDLPEAEYSDEDVLESDARPAEVAAREFDEQRGEAEQQDEQQQEAEQQDEQQQEAEQQEALQQQEAEQQQQEVEPQLENMVLVLDITPEELRDAPSFAEDEFPDVRDEEWHQAIVAFYAELLDEDPAVNGEPEAEMDEPAEAEEEMEQ